MRTVEVSRFVRATPAEIERVLDPATLVGYEGTFTVTDTETVDEGVRVFAGEGRMMASFLFEDREDGLAYEQEHGPLEGMLTTVTYESENEGSRVRARSSVSLGVPPAAITDRIAAWKRRGELRRALANLAADVE